MSDDKIVLDKKSFKSLASESRVNIIKSLERRRKTLTELSKQFSMSPSTVKEHLENMVGAGLIVQVDDGHKWKYYELTRKGKKILNPGETKIWVILSLSFAAILFTSYDLIKNLYSGTNTFAAARDAAGWGAMKAPAMDMLAESTQAVTQTIPQIPYIDIIGLVLFTVIFGLALGYYAGSRKSVSLPI